MDPNFWHQRWEKNEIAFHEGKPNALLVHYLHELSLAKGRRIFLPLCGKTRDISWLLSNGYRVAGAELSQLAIEQLFMDLGLQPDISGVGKVQLWSATHIDIFSLRCRESSSARSMPYTTGQRSWRCPKPCAFTIRRTSQS